MIFKIKSKNPWLVIITFIALVLINALICITLKLDSFKSDSTLVQLKFLAIIGITPFVIVYYLYQVIFTDNIEISITETEISSKFQRGFLCIQEEIVIKKEDIIKWEVHYPRSWDTIKITTNTGTYYIRALKMLFRQESFKELETSFRQFVG